MNKLLHPTSLMEMGTRFIVLAVGGLLIATLLSAVIGKWAFICLPIIYGVFALISIVNLNEYNKKIIN